MSGRCRRGPHHQTAFGRRYAFALPILTLGAMLSPAPGRCQQPPEAVSTASVFSGSITDPGGLLLAQAPTTPAPPAQPTAAPASGAAIQPRPPSKSSGEDLTQLSLDQLANLEIIPINVLGGHTHPAGQIMVGYNYMMMKMDGNRVGSSRVSVDQVLQQYSVSPISMTMEMHMLEVMGAPRNDLTLMAMIPYKRLAMPQVTRKGVHFTEHSDGLGDIELTGLYTVLGDIRRGGNRLIFNGGLSLPTGSIDKKDFMDDPSMGKMKLEYMMQLGSGTVDLMPGLTFLNDTEHWNRGAQLKSTLRLGQNSNHYRLGNRYELNGWAAYKVTDWFAPSVRLDGQVWQNIHGADPDLDPTVIETNDPALQGGQRLDILLGTNMYVPRGRFKGARLNFEGGVPLYQSLNGPQLGEGWQLTFGISYTRE